MLADINVAKIYVRTTGSLFLQMNIYWYIKNRQHSMLDDLDFNENSIETYKQEIRPTFVL